MARAGPRDSTRSWPGRPRGARIFAEGLSVTDGSQYVQNELRENAAKTPLVFDGVNIRLDIDRVFGAVTPRPVL